jgi:hypothetical protein
MSTFVARQDEEGAGMTTVHVPAIWVSQSHLPPRCARHGTAVTHTTKRTFYTPTPFWIAILAIFTLLIAAIVAHGMRKEVVAQLPSCQQCTQDRRRFKLMAVGLWLLLIPTFVLAASSDVGVLLFFVLMIGALVFSFCGDQFRVRGSLTPDLAWVELKAVDEAFASEINQAVMRGRQGIPAS